MRIALVAGLVLCVGGCATPYGPKGKMGGYEDRPLGEGRYHIAVHGNQSTELDTLTEYLHRRADEICGPEGYTSSAPSKQVESTQVVYGNQPETLNRYTVSAEVQCRSYQTIVREEVGNEPVRRTRDGKRICPKDPLAGARPPGYAPPAEANCVHVAEESARAPEARP